MIEALIDFGEGEDIEEGVYEEGLGVLVSCQTKAHKITFKFVQRASVLPSCMKRSRPTYLITVEARLSAQVSASPFLVLRTPAKARCSISLVCSTN